VHDDWPKAPGTAKAVRDYPIDALIPGELRSLAAIGDRVYDRLDPTRT
jgi:hypothetical protein